MAQSPLILEISDLLNDGRGLARFNGQAVFIANALPGETVEAEIIRSKKNYAEAVLKAIIKPSPQRVQPVCPHYEACGGCNWQHLAYPQQLQHKTKLVANALSRIGGLDINVLPTLAAPKPFEYRNRLQLHYNSQTAGLGFYANGSQKIIINPHCQIMLPALAGLAASLRDKLGDYRQALSDLRHISLRANHDSSELLLSFVGLKPNQPLKQLAAELIKLNPNLKSVQANWGKPNYGIYGLSWQVLAGKPYLQEQICGLNLQITAATFSQINHSQAEVLYQSALDFANIGQEDTVFDLYSGSGIIGLMAAKRAKKALCIEQYAPALQLAAQNAQLNDIVNCRFINDASEKALPQLYQQGQKADIIILDPPRAGCDMAVLNALSQNPTKRLIYISCDPATLARDLKYLVSQGYRVEKAQPVDMFCQTGKVETIISLSHF